MNIIHTESSLNWGGQEFRTLLEHNYLNQHNHNAWLLCDPNSALFKKATESGARNIIPIKMTQAFNIVSMLKIVLFCVKHKINLINSHGSKDSTLCLLAFLCGYPLIRSRQITSPIKKKTSYHYLCTHIIATAEAIKILLITKGVPAQKISVIGEGVDLNEYTPTNQSAYLREEFKLHDDDVVIVNIGMIREDKGQRYFLEAAKQVVERHANAKFFIIGESTNDKTLENQLREFINTYQLSHHFFMPGYRSDVAQLLHLADVAVIASTAVEAQSRIVPQAFSTQRTVVSTNTGGLTELVKHEINGLVVPPKDATAMANAINRLIEDTELKTKLSQHAYQFAIRHLSFDTMMEKTLQLYAQFIR
jgi:glycosyltransferase involved in cell wall biosynthesis